LFDGVVVVVDVAEESTKTKKIAFFILEWKGHFPGTHQPNRQLPPFEKRWQRRRDTRTLLVAPVISLYCAKITYSLPDSWQNSKIDVI
jgi:hypothetical protein